MRSKPETIANISIKEYCFAKKQIQGVVEASQFKWTFTYSFNKGLLKVNPPLGRALIENPLLKFLMPREVFILNKNLDAISALIILEDYCKTKFTLNQNIDFKTWLK